MHTAVWEEACGHGARDKALSGDEQLRGLGEDGSVNLGADFDWEVGEEALFNRGFERGMVLGGHGRFWGIWMLRL